MLDSPSRPPVPVTRSRDGWLGGVCSGLASLRGVSAGWIRLAFVAATLLAGLGAVVYLACWLIIPAQDGDGESRSPDAVVRVAQAIAGCAGLAALALGAATATVFGFGWLVFTLAAIVLVLGVGRRLAPGWALLPIAALAVPAVAVATSDVRLAPQSGAVVHAPARLLAARTPVYRSGLGTMLIDLRHSALPAAGSVPLRIEAGVRRTIVALPQARCVRVVVHYHVDTFVSGLVSLLDGRSTAPFSDLVLFGQVVSSHARGSATAPAELAGPVLDVDFSSQGGSLYIRSYPDTVNPAVEPNWPGYRVHLEPYPNLTGEPRRVARQMVAAYRARLAAQEVSARYVNGELPGPCVPPPAPAAARSQAGNR